MVSIHVLFEYSKKEYMVSKKGNYFFFTAFSPIELKKEKKKTASFMKVQTKLAIHLWENFAKLH